MNKQNSIFNSTFKESLFPSQAKITKKKSLSISNSESIRPQSKPQLFKMVSLIGQTQTTLNKDEQIEDSTELDRILKTHDVNDSLTQDLLENEGKRILEKLTENIYETTKGEFIINAKGFIQNKNNSITPPNRNSNRSCNKNEVVIHMHKHKPSTEWINSLILNTTKETDSKVSHYSNNMTFSPIAKTDTINLYKEFNKKSGVDSHKTNTNHNQYCKRDINDDNDINILSFVSKKSQKHQMSKQNQKVSGNNKQNHPKITMISNKSTNISLLPIPNSQEIKSFFDNKMKKTHRPTKTGVLSNNIIMTSNCYNSNTNSNKHKKSFQKKLTKQSDDGLSKTDYSYKQKSEITQDDFFHSRLFTSNNNRNSEEDFVNI